VGSLAAGACGLIVEVHPDPAHALSDGYQSLNPEQFAALGQQVHPGRDGRVRLRAVTSDK
jgi:3-deoxy-7-phosphoheptulonate synthase